MMILFASLWFELLICGLLFCALIACAVNEGIEVGVLLIVAVIALHDWYSPPERDAWRFIAGHWPWFLGGLVAYTPLGCGWSLFRWRQFVLGRKEEFEKAIQQPPYKKDESPEERRERLLSHYRPNASEHKRRLIAWIVYWPFDGTWYLVHDSLTAFFNAVYRRMASVYTRIVERSFEDQ